MFHNLGAQIYPVLLSTGIAVSATSTDHYTDCVDTRGYDGVQFLLDVGTTAETAYTAYAQLSATSSGTGTFIDCYGSTVTHTTGFGTGQVLMGIDVFRPSRRWARVYVDRGTTGELIYGVIALLYKAGETPTSPSTARGIADWNIVRGTSS